MTDILFSAPAERNRQPILEVLLRVLPEQGHGLEIASGTGQHIVHVAEALPDWQWQPSDSDPDQRRSISGRIAQAGLSNLLPPLDLDVLEPWVVLPVDAIIVANLLHISAPETLPALFEGAEAVLEHCSVQTFFRPLIADDSAFVAPMNVASRIDRVEPEFRQLMPPAVQALLQHSSTHVGAAHSPNTRGLLDFCREVAPAELTGGGGHAR